VCGCLSVLDVSLKKDYVDTSKCDLRDNCDQVNFLMKETFSTKIVTGSRLTFYAFEFHKQSCFPVTEDKKTCHFATQLLTTNTNSNDFQEELFLFLSITQLLFG